MKRIPIIATIVVLAAAAVMVALGIWQLGRADEKAAMIEQYSAALESGELQPFPADEGGAFSEDDLFHPTAFECTEILSREAISGRSARGQSGYAHIARCQTGRGPADVKLGWSLSPQAPDWNGGVVEGLIVRGGQDGARVQLHEPVAGLAPLAKPDPGDLPNNHLAYAGQWFFFALTALLIYGFALRSRWRKQD
ncbi:SURF1 family cytochrome oxidase biogenesis protein [Erythrobacter sp. GH1-10]|uniref:SURF1 family cytochrome oxidase biogenesis protein n=1 Tax=Erythrobacter sp. GH1-10 TaxID=3349334 RepID=UPI00387790CC